MHIKSRTIAVNNICNRIIAVNNICNKCGKWSLEYTVVNENTVLMVLKYIEMCLLVGFLVSVSFKGLIII